MSNHLPPKAECDPVLAAVKCDPVLAAVNWCAAGLRVLFTRAKVRAIR
jgi:hypothetical protein